MKNNNENFLHSEQKGTTICFQNNQDGTVTLWYQQTRDPNEELNEDTYPAEKARLEWKRYMAEGYRKANYWHGCKRDWSENRD